jgi:hypothetical protein
MMALPVTPVDVCHHVVELQIHLRQSFLHVLDVRGSVIQQRSRWRR